MHERGDLLLVPYPFTDLSTTKRRPVLALTAADPQGDFIALPVTSRPQRRNALALSEQALVKGSLPAASWVRTDRVITLHVSLVTKVFGRAASTIIAAAAEQVCSYIGHTRPDPSVEDSALS
jgi:PemK-like, MazF-like toxin of type II toxin-antitoxin system